jgi:hypothetical protein
MLFSQRLLGLYERRQTAAGAVSYEIRDERTGATLASGTTEAAAIAALRLLAL